MGVQGLRGLGLSASGFRVFGRASFSGGDSKFGVLGGLGVLGALGFRVPCCAFRISLLQLSSSGP